MDFANLGTSLIYIYIYIYIYEMKKYLYDICFNFRSVKRFVKIWLETMAIFILSASQVDVMS